MIKYFAIFKTTPQAIEVEFPDLPGCVTFGKNFDLAIENAIDVLAAWLANAQPKYIKEPSSYKKLQGLLKKNMQLIPIMVDPNIIEAYQALKRFNVIFPTSILDAIDKFRKKAGLKRSKLLQIAVEEYLAKHSR